MSTVTLEQAKLHLRVDSTAEDTLIQAFIDAAESHIARQLGEDMPEKMDAPLIAAALLLIGDLYVNRERQSEVNLSENTAFRALLSVYRSMNVAG